MKQRYESKGPSVAGGVVTGAVAGMVIGAAAVVLSKKENRKKLKKHVDRVLEMGEDKFNDSKDRVMNMKDEARGRVAEGMQKVTDKLNDAKADVTKKIKR